MKTKLYDEAMNAREKAYAPYSTFKVGAAILTKSGKIYTGCNIENASYSLTCCAERTAIFTAITQGEREFVKMVIIADSEDPISPCGACRQVMAEFFHEKMPIYLMNLSKNCKRMTVQELLPDSFHL